jgi:hypothetical protein
MSPEKMRCVGERVKPEITPERARVCGLIVKALHNDG